mmetsp:Transcript_58127/g.114350  ORF Transcript_58127/g.114350 Transcript_58127/m.114350 type:complete len:95 (-) Transcript_58127:205-489(-)|eukprot:CAMPEP_0171595512 /NCGR_PEP_ID=MMETSP0990-20121206/1375_1 /TAXON_ID=483369 /ORGANISM="non described non described, Strain CCMP2098" /LENGTH=94 /DNA_ID=CAMNT_0012156499 /DNA_START=83 /DNA_END=367 /DNA_ORIENTATION=+
MTPFQFIQRLVAYMVILGTALTVFVSQWAAIFLVFIGINLLQSTYTGICPPTMFIRYMGWIMPNEDGVDMVYLFGIGKPAMSKTLEELANKSEA